MYIPSLPSILHSSLIAPAPSAAGDRLSGRFDDTQLLRQRDARSIALLATIVLHLLLVWMMVLHEPLELKAIPGVPDGAITYIAPLALATQQPPSEPARLPPEPKLTLPPKPKPRLPPKPAPKPKPPPRQAQPQPTTPIPTPTPTPTPPLAASRQLSELPSPRDATPSLATERLTPAPNTAPQQDTARAPPEDDFSARIEANRRQRAEAQAQDPTMAAATPAESESQRASRIAKENVAFSRRKGAQEKDQSGGVFDVRAVGLRRAEFAFHGWSANAGRNSTQVVSVEQGTEIDLEIAVVKRLITFIRTMRTGEFVFESRRLGKPVTLNAGVAYENELQQFLLREFYPTYVRVR